MRIPLVAGKRARTSEILPAKESLYMIIPIILSVRCGVFGIHPFGVALFGAVMPSLTGILSVIIGGVTLGISGIKYILASLLFLYIIYIKSFDRVVSSFVLAGSVLFMGLLESVFLSKEIIFYIVAIAEGILSGLIYYIFLPIKKTPDSRIFKSKRTKVISYIILISAMINGFSGISFPLGIRLNILFASLLIMVISGIMSYQDTVSLSVIISLIVCLSDTGYITEVSFFAIAAVISSMLKEINKWGSGLGFLSALSIIMLLDGTNAELKGFYISVILSAVIYFIMPEFLLDIIRGKIIGFKSETDLEFQSALLKKKIKRVSKEHMEISKSIKSIESEIENEETEIKRESIYMAVSSVSQRADKDGISGDCYTEFVAENERFYAILCDGMGRGRKAYRESKMTVELLKEFIKTGFLKDKAVNMINSALAIKGDSESFSTVDMMELDMVTGDCEFLKIGSAESFIKHKEYVETLSSVSLPVGIIDDVKTETLKRRLVNGDMVIMVSDGVGEAGYGVLKGEWIKRLIKSSSGDTKSLSEEILTEAIRRSPPDKEDDMTVAVIKIIRNKDK